MPSLMGADSRPGPGQKRPERGEDNATIVAERHALAAREAAAALANRSHLGRSRGARSRNFNISAQREQRRFVRSFHRRRRVALASR